jgi:photosystem II stability/assembly factor-like uncharacterized protein
MKKNNSTMKTIFILLITLIPILGYSQWNGVYFHGDQENVLTVINKDTVVAATYEGGRIHRTTDGGKTWSFYQTVFTTTWFLDIHFPTSDVGYTCGGTAFGMHKNVLSKTLNGGQTWDSLTSNDYIGYSFTKLHFLNADTGFVAQEAGDMLLTMDGGTIFTSISTQGSVSDITSKPNKELFIARREYLSSNTYIYSIASSIDLGNSWSTVYTDTMSSSSGTNHRVINQLFFVNNTIGYAVGGNGLFLKTTDGGLTWTVAFISPYTNLTGLHFTTPEVGYINNAGAIYRTEDGGISWNVQKINPLSIIHQIQFANDTVGYALGDQGLYKTTSGGKLVSVSEQNHIPTFTIHPNPASNRIFITPISEQALSVAIYNHLGQIIKEFEVSNEFDVSFLSKGIYFLVIKTQDYELTKRFIKE